MEDSVINKKLDEIKRNMDIIVVSENNLDDNLKAKINGGGDIETITNLQNDVVALQSNKVSVYQGSGNVNKNVVTDSNGNITTEEKPTIPTVNNATLTIQKNGVDVVSFTANSSSNATANITVPTSASDIGAVSNLTTINGKALSSNITLTASDVGALSFSTAIGSNLSVSSNKLYLKDQNNNSISSGINIVQGVTLNGSSTKTPSFYAPTTAGVSGQVLKSNGSGAPTWQEVSGGGTEIEDSLTSSSTTSALSANQGRVLNSTKADCNCSNLSSSNVSSWQSTLNTLPTPSLTDGSAHTQTGQATVVESYLSSDKKTWYRIWSDGWKECGGKATSSNDNAVHINLPISFSNTNFTPIGSFADTTGFPLSYTMVETSSKIVLRWPNSGNKHVMYYCCGY